jgi:ribonuclease R
MELRPKDVIEFIRKSITRPLRIRELAKAMRVEEDDYRAFRKVVNELMKAGSLVSLKRGRIGLPEQVDLVVGNISITRAGTGFVGDESAGEGVETEDILIPPQHLSTALDGDRVAVRREGFSRGRQLGAVVTILERSRSAIVGVFHRSPHFCFVAPDDRRLHRDIYVPEEETHSAGEGDKVIVELFEWTDPYRNPEGKITEVLGKPGNPKVELEGIIQSFKLPTKFPAKVLREARKSAQKFDESEISRREDWRDRVIYTIDPASAKDHDDAISVETTKGGFRLGVHIADVSFFVSEDTALDAEAYGRGNSVYLPNRVIPMLPESLSNGLCSLKENEDRLAHSCIIDFDMDGKALEWRIADTVIRSRAKLSYEDAQSVFDGSPANAKAKSVREPLLLARSLAKKVAARRFAAGTLDFGLSEPQIDFDEKTGAVTGLGVKRRLEAHRLVEEFMLAANKAVALTFVRAALPTIYRVHDKPDPEKLKAFAELAKACGRKFPLGGTITPLALQRFLDSLKGAPEEEYLNDLALRSMKKAVYQAQNVGHFGLGFEHYTHFTSPIRRYADLVVHRLLRKSVKGKYPVEFAKSLKHKLGPISKHISATERSATEAEREAIKVMQVIFLQEHVGDEFTGLITGVVARGIFVRLVEAHAEGMVRVSSIDDDFYHFDSERHRLVGSRSRKVFRLGDRVKVTLVSVDSQRREIDLALVTGGRAAEKRVSNKRVSNKRVSKKGVSKERVSKKKGAGGRVGKTSAKKRRRRE